MPRHCLACMRAPRARPNIQGTSHAFVQRPCATPPLFSLYRHSLPCLQSLPSLLPLLLSYSQCHPPSLQSLSCFAPLRHTFLFSLSLARVRALSLSLMTREERRACEQVTYSLTHHMSRIPSTLLFFSWSFLLLPTTCRPCGRNRWLKTQRKQGHLSRLSDA